MATSHPGGKEPVGEAYSISMAGTEVKRREVIGHMKKMKKATFYTGKLDKAA
jgi:hypothetical protein